MAINLLNLQKHKVSTDLSGYITYIYGPSKVGKTTLAVQAPQALLLAFEVGYNALPGVIAQDITSWREVREVLRELKKPEVKETFKTIIIDTVDIASIMAEKFICAQNDVERISEIPYGGGYTLLKREFEEVFRTMTQLGYAVIFIAHSKDKTFKREDGTEYNQIVPSVGASCNEIVKNMADIIGYAHVGKNRSNQSVPRLTLRSLDNSVDCGCRFKKIEPEIDFTYDALANALGNAIAMEASETNGAFITDKPIEVKAAIQRSFEDIMAELKDVIDTLINANAEENSKKITYIVEKNLGKNKKVMDCTERQADVVELILSELKTI